jgi:hypothetical protein
VADCLANVALARLEEGQDNEAEAVATKALVMAKKWLGPSHPIVANCLTARAEVLYQQEKYAAAEPLYQRALAIRKKLCVAGHPDLVESLTNLAAVLENLAEKTKPQRGKGEGKTAKE